MLKKDRKDPFIDDENDNPEFKVQSNGKFHVKVEVEKPEKEKLEEAKKEKKKKKLKLKKKKSKLLLWFNWTVPILLSVTAFATLVMYPEPDQQIASQPKVETNKNSGTANRVFNAQALSQELVSRYFNGTDEDRDVQTTALAETLDVLSKSNNEQEANALIELQKSNLNAAKKSLISFSSSQSDLQKSSQTWINIGNIQNLSSSQQALQAYKKASDIDPDNVNAYTRQGNIHKQLKQFDLAEKAYKRVQSFANQSTANQALSIANFGTLNLSKGKLVEAEDAFNESLSIYKKIDDEAGIANTSFNLGNLYKDSDRFNKAEDVYKTALINFAKQNNFKRMADTRTAMGTLYQSMELTIKAQYQFEKALEISSNNNLEEGLTAIYQGLGEIAEAKGYTEKAEAYYSKANGVDPDALQDNQVADELGKLAIMNRKQGRFLEAEEQHKQAIKIYQQNKSVAGTISQQINLGFLYKAWGKFDLSCLVWRDTLIISQRANSNRTDRVQQLLDSSCL